MEAAPKFGAPWFVFCDEELEELLTDGRLLLERDEDDVLSEDDDDELEREEDESDELVLETLEDELVEETREDELVRELLEELLLTELRALEDREEEFPILRFIDGNTRERVFPVFAVHCALRLPGRNALRCAFINACNAL